MPVWNCDLWEQHIHVLLYAALKFSLGQNKSSDLYHAGIGVCLCSTCGDPDLENYIDCEGFMERTRRTIIIALRNFPIVKKALESMLGIIFSNLCSFQIKL